MQVPDNISLKSFANLQKAKSVQVSSTLYDIKINSLEGEPLDLGKFKGKFMLLVNVASNCGFTNQYKALQQLSETYGDELVVVGFPCNQFGRQEPGNASEIKSFCSMRYGVTFPLSEKIKVKGANQHPVYQWLTSKNLNGKRSSKVHWNFQKYLVNPKGQLIDVFYSTTSPNSKKITKHLSRNVSN